MTCISTCLTPVYAFLYSAFRKYSDPFIFFSHFVMLQLYAKIVKELMFSLINLYSIPHNNKAKNWILEMFFNLFKRKN